MNNFDDVKFATEAMTGGKNTVLLDDVGMPSFMVVIPKMNCKDLVAGATDETHPAFIVDGVEKDKVYISKYLNIVQNNRAYSLPMQDPKTNINFDNALTCCRNKGNGWSIIPFSLWAAIALWCKQNGTMPNGNNNYGADIEHSHENGVVTYTYEESSTTKNGRTATGSGPATWYHDHTHLGIADLNGNTFEWQAGMRLVEGELQFIPYANSVMPTCDMGVESSVWKALSISGALTDPGSSSTIKLDFADSKWQYITTTLTNQSATSRGCSFKNIGITTSSPSDGCRTFLRKYALLPEDGETEYGTDAVYADNLSSERFPVRGGAWYTGASAGVFCLFLNNARTSPNHMFGFRSVYYEL